MNQQDLIFYGPDLNARDVTRLGRQLSAVFAYMQRHDWVTLQELAEVVGASDASVSARLRQLRAMGHTVDRQRIEGSNAYAYRLRATR